MKLILLNFIFFLINSYVKLKKDADQDAKLKQKVVSVVSNVRMLKQNHKKMSNFPPDFFVFIIKQ